MTATIDTRVQPNAADLLALGNALARLRALGERPATLWKAVGNYGESSTRRRFVKGVGPDGKRWKVSRRVAAQGGQTLVQSSRLLRSITHSADNTGASWGSNVKYAAAHQFGAVIKPKTARALRFAIPGVGWRMAKRVTLPARPFLGVSAEDGAEIVALAQDAIALAAGPGHAGSSGGAA